MNDKREIMDSILLSYLQRVREFVENPEIDANGLRAVLATLEKFDYLSLNPKQEGAQDALTMAVQARRAAREARKGGHSEETLQ